MQIRNLVSFGLGLVVGAAAILVLRPPPSVVRPDLVDGKYLVVQCASGHWVYESGADGLKLVAKELSPEGLHAIWDLQSAYQPKSIASGAEELLHLPNTQFRTDTNSCEVVHKFYRMKDGKLVEVPLETAAGGK